MKKKLIAISLMIVLMFSSVVTVYGANVNVNGTNVTFTDESGFPFVDENNRTQVPLRVTMQKAGAAVTWDAGTKTATVSKRGVVVQIPVGAKYIIVDGKQIPTDTAAVIKNGRTYLPIRPVLEAVDFSVSWNGDTKTVFAASFFDYVENQKIVVEGQRANIKTAEDLLNYLISSERLEKDQDIARRIAERDYIDKFSQNQSSEPVTSVLLADWYTVSDLQRNGIDVDDSNFTIKRNGDFTECTYTGQFVLKGKNKSVTIKVPEFTAPMSYNDDDEAEDNGTERKYNDVTILFSPWSIEFKAEDLINLGLFN